MDEFLRRFVRRIKTPRDSTHSWTFCNTEISSKNILQGNNHQNIQFKNAFKTTYCICSNVVKWFSQSFEQPEIYFALFLFLTCLNNVNILCFTRQWLYFLRLSRELLLALLRSHMWPQEYYCTLHCSFDSAGNFASFPRFSSFSRWCQLC